MKTTSLKLKHGYITTLDSADSLHLSNLVWFVKLERRRVAAVVADDDRGKRVYLHRLILQAEKGQVVDHINGDPLDNRRINLRLCTIPQNVRNSRKQLNRSSQYKGVTWDKNRHLWIAKAMFHYRTHNLGRYATEIEAALAYDQFVRSQFKEFARPNFK